MQSIQQTTYKHFLGALLCKKLYHKQNKTITVKHNKDLYIAIKGTTTVNDWKNNFYLKRNDIDIHKGFSEYAHECMIEFYDERLTDHSDIENIIISSHSLGSCAAIIILYHMMKKNAEFVKDKNIDLLMFGSPKPGGKKFMEEFTKMCVEFNVTLYRYVNKYDVITNYPPLEGYSHVCDEIILDCEKNTTRRNLYQEHCMDSYINNIFMKLNR